MKMFVAARCSLLSIAAFLFANCAQADSFPHTSIDTMAESVDLIVEGTWVHGETVRVERVLKPAKNRKVVKDLRVLFIDQHDRRLGGLFSDKGTPRIMTRRAVLFLNWDEQSSAWLPVHTIKDGQTGSCGLFWYDGKHAYGYVQVCNPGPYCLVQGDDKDGQDAGGRVPPNVEALRKMVNARLNKNKR